jgi:hypothetical protein
MLSRSCFARIVWGLIHLVAIPAARGDDPVDFSREIAPLLETRCLRCHRPDNAKGGVSLATAEEWINSELVIPGDPDNSLLIDVVVPEAEGRHPRMPKQGEPLAEGEVDRLRRWIREGAKWPERLNLAERSSTEATWWSLRPLISESPPSPKGLPEAWASNPIDRYIFAKLAERNLSPSPSANRRALIRRVTYNLTGLPPSLEEVEAFLADETNDAYERVVDRLLASPRYGERWGRHWLDVVRFGESNGFERNVLINNAWPFRDYVIRSLNEDKPIDRMILEHLAGDVLDPGNPDVEVGTTFLVCGPYDNVGNQDPVQAAQIRANTIDDMIRAVGETFLGVTVGCARCHDHKFDPISQRDYYALYATLAGVNHGSREIASSEVRRERESRVQPLADRRKHLMSERSRLEERIVTRAESDLSAIEARWTMPPADRHGTEDIFEPVDAKYVRLTVFSRDDNPNQRVGFRIDEFEVWTDDNPSRNVALQRNGGQADGPSRTAEDFSDAYGPGLTNDGRFGARWIAAGPTLTITLERPERIRRVVFSSDRNRSLGLDHPLTAFVADYRLEVSTDGQTWTEVAGSGDRKPHSPQHRRQRLINLAITAEESERLERLRRELDRVDRELAAIPPLPSWWVGQFREAPGVFHVFLGGDPQKKGEPVVASSPSLLDGVAPPYRLDENTPEGQRRLALARWLVASSNPLTPRVLANRLWHYHFGTGIVDTPSDFGTMGGQPTHPELLDWLARQVQQSQWRLKPLHRMIVTSQTYRQTSAFRPEAAAIDGSDRLLWRYPPRRLDAEAIRDSMLSVAGMLDDRMGGPGFRLYRYLEDNVATYVPRDQVGPETYRRAVYHQNARAARVDLMAEFDCPDNAFAAPRRPSTTSPLQALTLMNHRFTLDMAEAFARRLDREIEGGRAEDHVRRGFQLAFSRPPTAAEQIAAVTLLRQHGPRALCRALLNASEFLYLD